jgi:hypothetical protein
VAEDQLIISNVYTDLHSSQQGVANAVYMTSTQTHLP